MKGRFIVKKLKYVLPIMLVFCLGVTGAKNVQAAQTEYVRYQWDEVTHLLDNYPWHFMQVQNEHYKTIRFKNYYTSTTSKKDITKWYQLKTQIFRCTKTFVIH